MNMDCRRPSHGFALPLVLWLIAVLMTLIAVLAYSARVGHIESRAQLDRVEAESAARAGITYAVARMDPSLGVEAWGPSRQARSLELDGYRIAITIRDEAGKLDLNSGDVEVLRALLQEKQVPQDQASRLLAGVMAMRQHNARFISPLPPVPGAPPPPAAGRNQRIEALSALRQWPGVRTDTVAALADDLTVHAGLSLPDARQASPAMRRALVQTGRLSATAAVADSTSGQVEFGSGTYAIESVATRPGRPAGRIRVVLRVFPRSGGGMASTWLAWEHGRWTQ